jgi:hypothetical protein
MLITVASATTVILSPIAAQVGIGGMRTTAWISGIVST